MSKSFNFSVLADYSDPDGMIIKKKTRKEPPKPEVVEKKPVKPSQKSVKKKQEKDNLQALAFGGGKGKKKGQTQQSTPAGKTNGSTPNLKKNITEGPQSNGTSLKGPSDDWKNRDQHFVEDQNEKELLEALMLSKLDYEANRDLYEQSQEEANRAKNKKKKKGVITISLSDFNTCDTAKLNRRSSNEIDNKLKSDGTIDSFFEDVEEAAKTTLMKESRLKEYNEKIEREKADKTVVNNTKKKDSPANSNRDSLLEMKDLKIETLRLENENLQRELLQVKLRNKKMCEVFGTAEMRKIGEVILELNEVTKERDEFSAEVASLSEQLEQEKTKVSQLQEKIRKK